MRNDRHFYVDNDRYDYLKGIKKQNSLPSLSLALEKIISEHQNGNVKEKDLQAEQTAEIVYENLYSCLKSVRCAVNNSGRNSKIALLLLNQLLLDGTSTLYSQRLSSQYIAASKIIDDKIQSMKTKKSNRRSENMLKVKNKYFEKNEQQKEDEDWYFIDESELIE